MIVADGSALVIAAVDGSTRGHETRARLLEGAPVYAPHLVDAEVGQAIRGLVLRGVVDATDGALARLDAATLVATRIDHRPLGARAFELRDNVSFYDGLYVALAEHLEVAMLTADRKLAAATGPRCRIAAI